MSDSGDGMTRELMQDIKRAAYEAKVREMEDRRERQSTWPAHLRDDAPFVVCSGCGRKSWSPDSPGEVCGMTQPDGTRCGGMFS